MYNRAKTIGASDAVHIWAGEWLDLYTQKRSQTASEPFLAAEIGKALEPLNRQWFSQQTGKEIVYKPVWADSPVEYHGKNPEAAPQESHFQRIPWCVYTPDGLIKEEGYQIPFEAKAVNPFWKEHNLIAKYMPQCQHAMRVMRAPYLYLSVFYLNIKWEFYRIEYDQPFDERLLELERQFFWHLDNEVPPLI